MGLQLSASARVSASLRPHTCLFSRFDFLCRFSRPAAFRIFRAIPPRRQYRPPVFLAQHELGQHFQLPVPTRNPAAGQLLPEPAFVQLCRRHNLQNLVSRFPQLYCLRLESSPSLRKNRCSAVQAPASENGRGWAGCQNQKGKSAQRTQRTESQSGQRGRTGDGNPQGSDSRRTKEKGN